MILTTEGLGHPPLGGPSITVVRSMCVHAVVVRVDLRVLEISGYHSLNPHGTPRVNRNSVEANPFLLKCRIEYCVCMSAIV